MKLWSGRFKKKTDAMVDAYTASIFFDKKLAEFDILGSIAHVTMLYECKLISKKSADLIIEGLKSIDHKIKIKAVTFSLEDEDIHMNIEKLLFEMIGDTAKQLHTGRSRNDQVALDMHLYLRFHVIQIANQLSHLVMTLLKLANEHVETIMPGYTHLQRAEPILFSHHLLAYANMFYRDIGRLCDSFDRININPLGAGALAGSGVAVNPDRVAELLGFEKSYENSLDAVSNRDFVIEFLSHAALIMLHISRLSEEIVLWSTQEFNFIQLDDAFSTGSSMMPQKKNPDVAELARGKTGRVYGSLVSMLTVMKALPLAYNKDMQEDKEGLFDTVETLQQTLGIYIPMLNTMQVNVSRMKEATEQDYSNATQLANYLVSKGLSFRDAHEITGNLILYCLDNSIFLQELPFDIYQKFCEKIEIDVYSMLNSLTVIESHKAKGGTAKVSVIQQLTDFHSKMQEVQLWLTDVGEAINPHITTHDHENLKS